MFVTDLALFAARCFQLVTHVMGLFERANPGHRLNPRMTEFYARTLRNLRRFDRIVQRWKAGTLPTPRLRAPRPDRPKRPAPATPMPAPAPAASLPKLWLNRLLNLHGQGYPPLEVWLHTNPELPELLKAAPQAGRLLRPLCRALQIIMPEYLKLPPRPPRPKPAKPAAPAPEPLPRLLPFYPQSRPRGPDFFPLPPRPRRRALA